MLESEPPRTFVRLVSQWSGEAGHAIFMMSAVKF